MNDMEGSLQNSFFLGSNGLAVLDIFFPLNLSGKPVKPSDCFCYCTLGVYSPGKLQRKYCKEAMD